MKKPYLISFVALSISTALASAASSLSVNFSENDANQVFAGNQNIGPLATNSSNWNNTSPAAVRTGTLATGSLNTPLVDDTGAATTATLTWASSNPWYNSDGTADDQHMMAVGYLDDGGSGISITVTNIPYAQYRVYGLLASDQGAGDTYTTLDFQVNGSPVLGGTATAYKSIEASNTAEGAYWTQVTTSDVGNYWLTGTQTSSTLTITAPTRNGEQRASISGFVIEQVPEPAATLLGCLGALTLLRRRRIA
jgi:hypothetical protein